MKLLSDASEYALRAVIWLAQEPREPRKVRDIAAGTCAAPGYLVKVLQGLTKAGILSAQRGVRGGFALIRDPKELSILEVINAVDPIERIRRCPLAVEAHKKGLCRMHQRVDDAMAMVEAGFGESTIETLLGEPAWMQSQCHPGAESRVDETQGG